ncbi:unnamed protein product [Lymnaea stagnalis]|uniref:BZIP domain-containing protein n=1 Tax=Lymnaea stagnalis TaxID=6523 RepID=A0AAV2HJJ0_LYMST
MPPKKSYDSYDTESEGDSQSGKPCGTKRQKLDKNSEEYKKRRERNNVAVRKSREASRQKAKDTMEKVARLREENWALEQKVTILNKELGVLRDLFLTHATATAAVQAQHVTKVKKENGDDEISEDSCAKSDAASNDHLHFLVNNS